MIAVTQIKINAVLCKSYNIGDTTEQTPIKHGLHNCVLVEFRPLDTLLGKLNEELTYLTPLEGIIERSDFPSL